MKSDQIKLWIITGALIFYYNIVTQPLFAQNPDTTTTLTTSDYVQSLSHVISLKTNINDNVESFVVTAPNFEVDLRPNTNLSNSYNFSYEFIIFSYSYNAGFINRNVDEDERGKTKIIRYGTDLGLGPYIVQHISYQKIRGFYAYNSADFPAWQEGDPYFQFPKLNYLSWHGITTYRPNKKYSIFSTIASNQRQLRSAGSFIYSLSYRYYIVDNRDKLTGTNSTQRSNNFEGIASIGYAYTYVLKRNFYLSGGAFAGAGLTRSELITRVPTGTSYTNFKNYDTSRIYKLEGFAAMGYDNGNFFTGGRILGVWTERFQAADGSAIFNNRVSYQVFVGFRFRPPGFLQKAQQFARDVLPII